MTYAASRSAALMTAWCQRKCRSSMKVYALTPASLPKYVKEYVAFNDSTTTLYFCPSLEVWSLPAWRR